ncbi:MAG: M20/M25/M40 family metallo-hydrolase, partial [Deltaproteobacteria bacterium]|nr:M20/M25/M40 family metallo-hydrolase [Deltaproteobacteria bacterium]
MRNTWIVRLLGALVALVVLLVAVVVVRGLTVRSNQVEVSPEPEVVSAAFAAQHLSEALSFRTISHEDLADFDPAPFAAFQEWLAGTYPRMHAALERETFGTYAQQGPYGLHALLYTWRGTDPALDPVLFIAHQDVVPVEPGTEGDWEAPPFSGARVEDTGHGPGGVQKRSYVVGRGAIDMKLDFVGLCEGVEALLAQGWTPRRTLLFAFGHDEEVGGRDGNLLIAQALQERGVTLHWILDEGMIIADGMVPGLASPAALVAIAEKGYVSVELVARDEGGHSSMPPPHTAVGRVARAVTRLEENPLPAGLDGPAGEMFARLGPEMTMPMRIVFANRWLFAPIVLGQLTGKPSTNATVRTTTAATMFEGSEQDNVLPQRARAVVNFRIHPRDSVATVLEHVETVIDDPLVEVRRYGDAASEPSPVSRVDGPGYAAIERSIRAAFPEVIVAPSLLVGASDSRHYTAVARDVYRFNPAWLGP